jgi:hypothetical protein
MRKIPAKIETRVFMSTGTKKRSQKEKIWVIAWLPIRRHSRSLYVPIPYEVCLLYKLKKGDLLKITIHSVRHAPEPDEPLKDEGEL